jgi:hypothetical protein
MSGVEPKIIEPNIRRRRWGAVTRDIFLLPPALLYVVIEHVFWVSAKFLLHTAEKVAAVTAIQEKLARLPPAAVLPLFLLPEIFSHIGGFWATWLLAHRKWMLAILAGVLVKGFATLLAVWIYQSCRPALMSVKWFAWLHGKAERGRDWVAERIKPARLVFRRSRSGIIRRFIALRSLLARRLGLARK